MPYEWTQPDHPEQPLLLRVWPYRSLPRRGFAGVILLAFGLILIPMIPVLGTMALWGVLPFLLLVLSALWLGLRRSYRDGGLIEELTIGRDALHLERHNPRGGVQEWDCNRYWARVEMHPRGGPVDHYITLSGSGRVVEIGAFLSEEERKALYGDLERAIRG